MLAVLQTAGEDETPVLGTHAASHSDGVQGQVPQRSGAGHGGDPRTTGCVEIYALASSHYRPLESAINVFYYSLREACWPFQQTQDSFTSNTARSPATAWNLALA